MWRLAVDEQRRDYLKAGVKLSKDEAEFELVANTIQKILGSREAMEGVAQYSREDAQALLSSVDNILDRVTTNSTAITPESARLVQAQKALAAALGEVREQRGDGMQYSIRLDENNRPFVEVEEDILAGVPENQWVKTVKENLKKKFPNGVTVGDNQIQIDRQTRREMTYSKYMQWLYNNDRITWSDKLRATNNADEIVKATTDWVNTGLIHERNDALSNFAEGVVLLRVGSQEYTARVVVGAKPDGSMKLYDVLDLTPVQIKEKETGTAKTENPSPGADINTATISSDHTIPQNPPSVNPSDEISRYRVGIDTEDSGRQYSLDTETDRQYMDAVESGNMDEAQRMVDEAAKQARLTEARRADEARPAGGRHTAPKHEVCLQPIQRIHWTNPRRRCIIKAGF